MHNRILIRSYTCAIRLLFSEKNIYKREGEEKEKEEGTNEDFNHVIAQKIRRIFANNRSRYTFVPVCGNRELHLYNYLYNYIIYNTYLNKYLYNYIIHININIIY